MSVYIKGMEMPKNPDGAERVFIKNDGKAFVDCGTFYKEYEAISVPDHGRLIDADVLKTAFPCGESVRTECVRATIDHMPTIIPASKEGKK